MIRRDYILRMIEEFVQALARINALRKGQRGRRQMRSSMRSSSGW